MIAAAAGVRVMHARQQNGASCELQTNAGGRYKAIEDGFANGRGNGHASPFVVACRHNAACTISRLANSTDLGQELNAQRPPIGGIGAARFIKTRDFRSTRRER